MNKFIFASLLALSFITPSINGAALVQKFKGLSCTIKIVALGLAAGTGALAYTYPERVVVSTEHINQSKNDIITLHTGIRKVGEVRLTSSCSLSDIALYDRNYSDKFFHSVLKCAADKKCKSIEYHGNSKLYGELKAYAEANPLPAVK